MSKPTHFINGQWVSSQGTPFKSTDPANGETIWEGTEGTEREIDIATSTARKIQIEWSKLDVSKRIQYLQAFKNLLEDNKKHLAETISQEVGKPLWESLTEVGAMIGKINISIQSFEERCPTKTSDLNGITTATRHKPHGCLAVFGPYNFPGHLPNGHIIPALIAGNTVIFKPSELTPLVAQETMKLWEMTNIPKGVIQLIQGTKNTAISLSAHKEVDGLLFTGSWETGSIINQKYTSFPEKILALELGGNNPLIVFDCNDLPAAAYTTILSAYFTSGQRCTCARRLIVHNGSEGENIIELLREMIPKISIGDYRENPEPFMGPLISEQAANSIFQAQIALIAKGAVSIVTSTPMTKSNAFVTPGLIDVTHVQNREDKEYFGPLLQLIRVDSFDEAIREANNTGYGLAAGLLSDNEDNYNEFFHRIRAGIVNWNNQTTGASSNAPFGGIGKSGNFHPSAYYAADYCSYPVASMETTVLKRPEKLLTGLEGIEGSLQ
ncbi:MAG: succinylglutamate-semialdehyde dehydrogenase [Chlamydiota bacterium]